jgi:hypothetical protein
MTSTASAGRSAIGTVDTRRNTTGFADERAPGSGDSTVIRCTTLVHAALLQQASSSSRRPVDDAAPWPTKRAATRAA